MVNLKTTNDLTPKTVFFPLHKEPEPFRLENDKTTFSLGKTSQTSDIDAKKAKLRKAAEGFEAIFIRMLFSTMRTTMSEGSMFGSGTSGEIYGDIIDSAVADVLADKSALGLADMLYRSMEKSIDTGQRADSGKKAQ